MPEISVITGAYNIGQCYSFHKSMESVLNQSFDDFEFIICDDGSTDNTWELLESYAEKDERIQLLRNEKNMGLAASLNKCIALSRGKFVARHDCDDFNDIHRFEKQLAYLKSNKDIAVLGCNAYLFDENGVWGKEAFPEQVTDKDFLFTSPYKHGSVMFRKEALMTAGCYRVAKETYRAEDYDLFMTIQTFCNGANLQEYLYFYCEDNMAKKRRKFCYRIDETKVRYLGFKKLGLLPKGWPYVIKPLIVGLLPIGLLEKLKEAHKPRKFKEKEGN